MSGINDWLDLMPSTITVQSFVSRTAYGVPSYASPVSYRARVNYNARLVRVSVAEEAVARGEVWIATVDKITVQDKIELPDGTYPLILTVNQVSDENGPLYTRLDFA